jgi:hypothetical protein
MLNSRMPAWVCRGAPSVVDAIAAGKEAASHLLADNYAAIPEAMRNARRWLLWRKENKTDQTKKPRKVPYYANGGRRTGELDSPADRERLASFDDAISALKIGKYSGLGFALGPDGTGNVWQGIDLDHMHNRPALQVIGDELPGYTETSPSGNGMHAIGYGKPFASLGSNSSGIEAYSGGRFFTVTGKGVGIRPPACLAEFVVTRLKPIHGSRPATETQAASQTPDEWVSPKTVTELRSALLFMRSDDRDLWQRMGHALKTLGDVGRGLFMEWSATSPSFDPKADARTWESFKPTRTGYQAIFAEAKRMGWINPASNAARLPTIGTPPQYKGFEFVQAHNLLSKPEAVPWLIDGMIERGSLATLFGASGSGKSFMAIDWSCCIATGSEWNGKETEQGAVFYIAGEGHAGIRRRLKAWETHTGTSLRDAPLFVSTCPAALMDKSSALSVADAVDLLVSEHGSPNLIVIDTLARNLGNGEENSNADIGLFINNIDVSLRTRFDATVLIVHHTGWAEKERARGASAMRAAMDSEYRLDLSDDVRTLVCTKAKESEAADSMSFTLKQVVLDGWDDSDGELMTSAVLISSITPPKRSGRVLTRASRIALDALAHALGEKGEAPTEALKAALGVLTPSRVVHEDVWRQRAYDEGISDGTPGAKKKAFSRSRKYLLDTKKVSTWQDMYWAGSREPASAIVEQIKC